MNCFSGSQYGIRFIDIAVERSAQWLMALARAKFSAAPLRRAGLVFQTRWRGD